MSPPKYKYNPTTHYMLEFPSPNWLLVSNSKLTSAAQDVVFFFFFSQFFGFESLAIFPNLQIKNFKKSRIRLLLRCKILPKKSWCRNVSL